MYIDVYGQGNAQNRNTANSWAQSAVSIPNNTIYLVRYNNQYSYWVNNNTATANEDRRSYSLKGNGSTYWQEPIYLKKMYPHQIDELILKKIEQPNINL